MFKLRASTEIGETSEIHESSEEKVLDIHELMRDATSTMRGGRAEPSGGEASDNLRSLLDGVSETSAREVDNLIDELQRLREKLREDSNRIRRDIEEYTALNQQVMKLTQVISESVQDLPNASRIRSVG